MSKSSIRELRNLISIMLSDIEMIHDRIIDFRSLSDTSNIHNFITPYTNYLIKHLKDSLEHYFEASSYYLDEYFQGAIKGLIDLNLGGYIDNINLLVVTISHSTDGAIEQTIDNYNQLLKELSTKLWNEVNYILKKIKLYHQGADE